MKIICKNCKHKWDYKGKQEFYCTCPKCYYKVNIKKCYIKIKSTENGK